MLRKFVVVGGGVDIGKGLGGVTPSNEREVFHVDYEKPEVFDLQAAADWRIAHGGDCNKGSKATSTCHNSGSGASGACDPTGAGASGDCTNGGTAGLDCNVGNGPLKGN